MIAASDADAAGLVALALDFHRTPTRHADLLHGPAALPQGVTTLLKLAGSSDPDPALLALAPADELRAAAQFFIEQVLFRRDASHYRVLGLDAHATPEQVKEHHRLLMRVFHPDRENRADDWKDAFATRINLAYTALRDADERRRYDAALACAARPGTSSAARPPVLQRRPAPSARRGMGLLPPFVQRHLPQWVLAGSALVALAVVGVVYLNNPQAPSASAISATQPPASTATPAAQPERVAADLAAPAVPERAEAHPTAESPAPVTAVAPTRSAAPRSQAAVDALQRVERPNAPVLPESAPPSPPSPPVQATAPAPVAPANPAPAEPLRLAASPALAEAKPAAVAATPAAPASAAPAAADPGATLARFLSCYERGDTPSLMALFDEVAIGGAGGKPQIRREHEALFRATDLRHLAVEAMTWTRDGDWYRGVGRYRATQMRKGEQWLRSEVGTIRVEMQQRGGQALIMVLDYQPGERS